MYLREYWRSLDKRMFISELLWITIATVMERFAFPEMILLQFPHNCNQFIKSIAGTDCKLQIEP